MCKWLQFIFSQELSIKHYPKQVGLYLLHHFNIITTFTQVHKSPFYSSVPHTRFVWGTWIRDLNSVTQGHIALSPLKTIDNKHFRDLTQPHSTLDDATMCRAVRGILCVTVRDVCWFPLYTDVDRIWKYLCLNLNYIFVVEKCVC